MSNCAMTSSMLKQGDKVFLVTYALTSGILADTVISTQPDKYVRLDTHRNRLWVVGRDVFTAPVQAQQAARAMRDKKLKSLDKQRARLAAMEFAVPAIDQIEKAADLMRHAATQPGSAQ